MALRVTRVFGDADGETRLATVEIPTTEVALVSGMSRAEIPTTTMMIYVEYPEGEDEIMPGFHSAPRRQLVLCLQGSFEVSTTTGETHVFGPGDWFLADDVGTRGHVTRGVGPQRRINLAIGLDPAWQLPVG